VVREFFMEWCAEEISLKSLGPLDLLMNRKGVETLYPLGLARCGSILDHKKHRTGKQCKISEVRAEAMRGKNQRGNFVSTIEFLTSFEFVVIDAEVSIYDLLHIVSSRAIPVCESDAISKYGFQFLDTRTLTDIHEEKYRLDWADFNYDRMVDLYCINAIEIIELHGSSIDKIAKEHTSREIIDLFVSTKVTNTSLCY
jgi:hypothetical protein